MLPRLNGEREGKKKGRLQHLLGFHHHQLKLDFLLRGGGWREVHGVEEVEEGFVRVPDKELKGPSPSQIIDISN